MPNHITNRLRVLGARESIDKLFATIAGETCTDGTPRYIDFNKIIPMPEELDIPACSTIRDAANYIRLNANEKPLDGYGNPDFGKVLTERMTKRKAENPKAFEQDMENGRKYLENAKNYGAPTWYEWRIHSWGTKWNAYDQKKCDEQTIMWRTAWSGVPKLIANLAAMFPMLRLEYDYADEDVSYNIGSFIFGGGVLVEDNTPIENTAKAYELCFELGVVNRDYFVFTDGNYKYADTE